jgi:heme exporter protein D
MDLGPHAGFILAAYAAALIVIGALIGWVVTDHRAQQRTLDDLEARGIMRRSAGTGAPQEAV